MKIGDLVKPKPEWIGSPANVPTGYIRSFAMAGQAIYVHGERRAFGSYIFDVVELPTIEQGSAST